MFIYVYIRLCTVIYVYVRSYVWFILAQGDISRQLLENYERREEMTRRQLLGDLSEAQRAPVSVTKLTCHHATKVCHCGNMIDNNRV